MADGRVLICESRVPFVHGGAELYVLGLRSAIERAGLEVDVVSMPYEWDPPERILKSALMWRLVDLADMPQGSADLVVATKFPTYAVEHGNKVAWLAHQHRSAYDLAGTIYDDFTGLDDPDAWREAVRDADSRFLGECRALFTISENVGARLKEHCGLASETVYHPPPLDGRYWSGEYGSDILLVGRLEPLKRVDLAIRSMRYVKSPGAVLRIAGTGFLEGPLKELAEREGVRDRVSFEGFVTDEELLALYARAGVVLYVPYDEDMGYVPLEAFKSSRPVVVTDDSGGPLEFVKDGVTGAVARALPDEVAAAVDALLADPARARRLGERGLESVEGITWDRVIDKVVLPFLP